MLIYNSECVITKTSLPSSDLVLVSVTTITSIDLEAVEVVVIEK